LIRVHTGGIKKPLDAVTLKIQYFNNYKLVFLQLLKQFLKATTTRSPAISLLKLLESPLYP
jgi:hypothetical protein